MGILYYGSGRVSVPVDDRLLAHLKAVVTSKLRRGEGLLISWSEGASTGRNSVWVHPGADLHYKFDGSRPPVHDDALINLIALHSHDPRGIDVNDPRYRVSPSAR